MGKRSDFARRAQDAYDTPPAAIRPLLRHLIPNQDYYEPCVGNGALVRHLRPYGHIALRTFDLKDRDARTATYRNAPLFITNPPWERDTLHKIIVNLSNQAPTWLIIDADWAHTKQASPYLDRLRMIVSIGRVKWIPDSPYTGKDSCAWHLFARPATDAGIEFVGRRGVDPR